MPECQVSRPLEVLRLAADAAQQQLALVLPDAQIGSDVRVAGQVAVQLGDLQPVPMRHPGAPSVYRSDESRVTGAGDACKRALALGACRAWGVDSEKRPQRGQFLPDLQTHTAMGQKAGKKWTAEAVSQPTIPKSDRLVALTPRLHPASRIARSPRHAQPRQHRAGQPVLQLCARG